MNSSDPEIKDALKKLTSLYEETKDIYKEDRERAVSHYDMLKRQWEAILDEIPYSDDGVLEREMNKALAVINDCQKTLVPIINSISKILETLIKAETIKSTAQGFIPYKKVDAPVDINQLHKYIEED